MPRLTSPTIRLAAILAVLALVTWWVAGAARSSLQARLYGPTIDWVVPARYTGWLVTAWNCDGGDRLTDLAVGTEPGRYRIFLAADGTACITGNHPEPRITLGTFTYPDGSDAPVLHGITRGATETFNPGAGEGTPSVVSTGRTYTVHSIGIGDDYVLGDACGLKTFLHDRFDEPDGALCGPIYHTTPPDWYVATAEAARSATPTGRSGP